LSRRVDEAYLKIRVVIQREFPDITLLVEEVYGKVRVHLIDGSYLDVWLSRRIPGRFAYHWEHRQVDGGLHRHDNRPHEHLRCMRTFPKHLHDGSEENVKESAISDNPEKAVKEFLSFIKSKLKTVRMRRSY